MSDCKKCGTPMEPKVGTGRPRLYCSDACRTTPFHEKASAWSKRRAKPEPVEVFVEESAGVRIMTMGEAGLRMSISTSMIRNLIRRGELPTIRIGRSVRIDKEDIQKFIDTNRVVRGPAAPAE